MKYFEGAKSLVSNKYKATQLVREQSDDMVEACFTLNDDDIVEGDKTFYSLKKLFLQFYNDPTEITFVDEVFNGNYEHWKYFRDFTKAVRELYAITKEEAELRLLKDAIQGMSELAASPSKAQAAAIKFLADRGMKVGEEKRGRGRPKKAPEVDTAAGFKSVEEEDAARMFN